MAENAYSVLYEAYEHYAKTGDKHFRVLPKTLDYYRYVIGAIPTLREEGYICNVSNNLLIERTNSFNLVPVDDMSFDITIDGIMFAEDNRK